MDTPIHIFWFRRDLRLNDNCGLAAALSSGIKVLPVFIFDNHILDRLSADDARIAFIHKRINDLNQQLVKFNTAISVYYGKPEDVFTEILGKYSVKKVYTNRDYEPYAIGRDKKVAEKLGKSGIAFETYKDQVLFEAGEILKQDGKPYVVFTPYAKKWLSRMNEIRIDHFDSERHLNGFLSGIETPMPSLEGLGFRKAGIGFPSATIVEDLIEKYAETRDYPGLDSTSRLGLHLRFGTISIRDCILAGKEHSRVWLNELIWREFFMQILFFFPNVVNTSFKPEYDRIQWLNDETHYRRWCEGATGYPLVDAGMRELRQTGFMHNRVRMVVAGFLTKHLLIDWRWGEAWFAEKLLDFELSSNNGNWQWAAGTGCDAAPYFRIFNPSGQAKKFDPQSDYIKKWVPESGTHNYPEPIVDHAEARIRCLITYKNALKAR
ncbi:MAG: deoxyribodipyrimidine photo-lyase [Bacteroidota bacterium]